MAPGTVSESSQSRESSPVSTPATPEGKNFGTTRKFKIHKLNGQFIMSPSLSTTPTSTNENLGLDASVMRGSGIKEVPRKSLFNVDTQSARTSGVVFRSFDKTRMPHKVVVAKKKTTKKGLLPSGVQASMLTRKIINILNRMKLKSWPTNCNLLEKVYKVNHRPRQLHL